MTQILQSMEKMMNTFKLHYHFRGIIYLQRHKKKGEKIGVEGLSTKIWVFSVLSAEYHYHFLLIVLQASLRDNPLGKSGKLSFGCIF